MGPMRARDASVTVPLPPDTDYGARFPVHPIVTALCRTCVRVYVVATTACRLSASARRLATSRLWWPAAWRSRKGRRCCGGYPRWTSSWVGHGTGRVRHLGSHDSGCSTSLGARGGHCYGRVQQCGFRRDHGCNSVGVRKGHGCISVGVRRGHGCYSVGVRRDHGCTGLWV